MRRIARVAGLLLALGACAARPPTRNTAPHHPPVAERRPVTLTAFGQTTTDDYAWMRSPDGNALAGYLAAENAYTDAVLLPQAATRALLVDELLARVPHDASAPPARRGEFLVQVRTGRALDHPVVVRWPADQPAAEPEIVVDVNALARGQDALQVSHFALARDGSRVFVVVDEDGSEEHHVLVRELPGGAFRDTGIRRAGPTVALSHDGRTVFYTRLDDTQRPAWVHARRLDAAPGEADPVLYAEPDPRFSLELRTTRDDAWVLVDAGTHATSQTLALDPAQPGRAAFAVTPRTEGVEATADHLAGYFIVVDNAAGPNFRVRAVPEKTPLSNGETWIAHRADTLVEDVEPVGSRVVLHVRRGGRQLLEVYTPADGSLRAWAPPGDNAALEADVNLDPTADSYRVVVSSPAKPAEFTAVDLATLQPSVLKRLDVGPWREDAFTVERRWAVAHDGERVPVVIARRRDVPLDGTAPALLEGYGAYGASNDAYFDVEKVPLLERGWVVAWAQVRGGRELGAPWHEAGRRGHKVNTFADFIAVAELLLAQRYTSTDRLCAWGGSAGGLLLGAVLNQRPELFHAVVAEVPFVDVITTMSDASQPLTAQEWDEWGNPAREDDYRVMAAYSPYENVARRAYPHLLVTAGLHDNRVRAWEPARWVARLRRLKTDNHDLLLRTHMDTGHGGATALRAALAERAELLAFLLAHAP